MATYVSPMIEEIADYTDTTRGYYLGWADAFGGGFGGGAAVVVIARPRVEQIAQDIERGGIGGVPVQKSRQQRAQIGFAVGQMQIGDK